MIPVQPLDGSKIIVWNKLAYFGIIAAILTLALIYWNIPTFSFWWALHGYFMMESAVSVRVVWVILSEALKKEIVKFSLFKIKQSWKFWV